MYAELHCLSNFSFLRGASHPQELVHRAKSLGYRALAITDECSLAGIVRAHVAARECGLHLIVGSEFQLSNGERIVALAPSRRAYSELSGFITLARRRSEKGSYQAHLEDLRFRLQHCFILWLADASPLINAIYKKKDSIYKKKDFAGQLSRAFPGRLWIAIQLGLAAAEQEKLFAWKTLAAEHNIPVTAGGAVLMHERSRKPLQDVLTAIREKSTVPALGTQLQGNAEAYLRSLADLRDLYPAELLSETCRIAERCHFSLDELKYQYPRELVPEHSTPIQYLRTLVEEGSRVRWPQGVPKSVLALIEKELQLIHELSYEYYFLTVYDLVKFARSQGIFCQGRGSAANSVVCYCLMITEISPDLIKVLFERFISKERNEPPDIDVDFENARREEVIQYIYEKYSRERAALAATVITYRSRSAIRDVGKALGLDQTLVDQLAKSLAWWDRRSDLQKRIDEAGLRGDARLMDLFFELVHSILGFPRHLSQHVGGFVITQDKISDIVPVENASMAERTVIQWDKEDLESLGLMKVDVLALGMLTAIRKCLSYVQSYEPSISSLADIPKEDGATYQMLCAGDSVGVFQVESRAQLSMLPRLKPKQFYDLVIQIAIVRPGPIQGGMVHPYLKRRNGLEEVSYYNDELKDVLESTLGIPIFQEQAIRLSMVAAGFSGGEADELRRAMATWGKNGNLLKFERKFIDGMLSRGYPLEFAERLFEQIKGFGGYGFPESHSASFALLCYFSSWLKCHHPTAFYCALLNSQPMGFYSASQLVQDAHRHNVKVLPVDINSSQYENSLEGIGQAQWALRLGFIQVKSLDAEKAQALVALRAQGYRDIDDILRRTPLSNSDLQVLASAEALRSLCGHRYQSRWQVAGAEELRPLLNSNVYREELTTRPPALVQDIIGDYDTTRLSLRPHLMAILRREKPFCFCKKQSELLDLRSGAFVQVAGLVTGRQRPGTANGTIFLTLEDESGNINVIVWRRTQELFRKTLLSATVLLVKGTVEMESGVVHVIAGQLHDYSQRLENFELQSRDFH